MTQLTFRRHTFTLSGPASMLVPRFASSSTSHHAAYLPAACPAGQAYYWRRAWQRGEQESLRDIEAGRVERFSNPSDAIRWLLSDDAEDD
jgi:hypothetical protein